MVSTYPVYPKPAATLVIGGGIAGMRSVLDLADVGLQFYLIEQSPYLGGRVAQLGYMFPRHDCVLCRGTPDHGCGCTHPSISPAYIHHNQHPNNERGWPRVQRPSHLMQGIGLEPERWGMLFMSGSQAHAFAATAHTITERRRQCGPNPLKTGHPMVEKEVDPEDIKSFRGRR